MARFSSMDSEFTEGQLINGEFYGKRTKKRRQTKDEALYGVFDDSESDGGSKRRRIIGGQTNLSKPLNFVSTGIAQTASPKKDEEDGRQLEQDAEQKKRQKGSNWNRDGIGSKLLEKMGYKKGSGLGKYEHGITEPIAQVLRPKNMGMGYNNFDSRSAGIAHEEDEIKPKDWKPKVANENLWLKKNKNKKRDLLTAAELLAQQQEKGFETVQTLLDMRGPQVRVLTNLERLNAEERAIEDNTPMPELQHNLRLIVDLVEADIQNFDRKLKHERHTVQLLERDRKRLEDELIIQNRQMDTMNIIMSTIQGEERSAAERRMTLESIANAFGRLQADFPEDYKLHNLSAVALSFVAPCVASIYRGWMPLTDPLRGLDSMRLCKRLLQGADVSSGPVFPEAGVGANDSSPYSRLVMETVIPALRSAVTNNWEAREPETLLRVLEGWDQLLPGPVLQTVLDNVVMPKLMAAVDSWRPLSETIPIHRWLHPWLPLLGSKMEPLYLPIQYKLGVALQAWHPSDSSAYAILSPWQAVFYPGSWEQLLVRSIIPKLLIALNELVVNPANQQISPFKWVLAWSAAVPIHHMVGMLEAHFFPKWQQVLYHWLRSNPNFDEVTGWYLGWKSSLPRELQDHDRIRHQLNVALEMMNQAVEGAPVLQPDLSYLHQHQQPQEQHMMGNDEIEMSLKEVVEAYAQQNEIQFLPKVGRLHEGLQVYEFGTMSICVDTAKQVVLAQSGDRWISVSLEQLLEMHRSRSASHDMMW